MHRMWLRKCCTSVCCKGGDALELALKQVEQQYGKGSIMRLGR